MAVNINSIFLKSPFCKFYNLYFSSIFNLSLDIPLKAMLR